MVFSDADPTFSISSILSRYDPSVSSAPGANTPATPGSIPSRVNSDRKSNQITRPNVMPPSKVTTTTTTVPRPSLSGPSKLSTITSSVSRTGTTSAVTSSKTDAGAIAKKRKIEEGVQSSMEKQRAALLAKAKKPPVITGTNKPTLSKISTAGTRPGAVSAGNTPTEAPKKVGYKELLARAAQAQAEKKTAPGTITHKARPQIKEQKAWQKKLEEQKAGKAGGSNGAERSSKSPGITSGGEKGSAAGKKAAEPVKTVAGKKGVGGVVVGGADSRRPSLGSAGSAAKGKVMDKAGRNGSAVDIGAKRKRESPPRGGYGSGRSGNGYSLPRKNMSRRFDTYEDEEDDGFVVDDEDDVPARGRSYGGGAGGKKYTYYESDYDSGSDMEAAGIDVLEEEERSRRAAVLEDQAQERLEKEMAARKAAMKKKLAAKKK